MRHPEMQILVQETVECRLQQGPCRFWHAAQHPLVAVQQRLAIGIVAVDRVFELQAAEIAQQLERGAPVLRQRVVGRAFIGQQARQADDRGWRLDEIGAGRAGIDRDQ
jgi:hypothetical protein